MLALSAVRALPQGARWLGGVGGGGRDANGSDRSRRRCSSSIATTLGEIQQVGYAEYATRQLRPYVRAAASQFSPGKLAR